MYYEEPMPEHALPPEWPRRCFSRLGLGLAAYLAAHYISAQAIYVLFYVFDALGVLPYEQAVNGIPLWAALYILPSAVALLFFYLIVRRVPAQMPETRQPMPPLSLIRMHFVGVLVTYLVSYLTEYLMSIIGRLRGAPVFDPTETFSMIPMPVCFLAVCVAAPVLEELTFRQLLIPRLRPYGDRFALIASALCFGLMHGNLNQAFYATATGLVLGYVFLKTGCVWQTMLLHALLNLISVISLIAMQFGDPGAMFLSGFIMLHLILGAVFFRFHSGMMAFSPGVYSLGNTWRTFFLNFGMICFFLLFAIEAVMYLMM